MLLERFANYLKSKGHHRMIFRERDGERENYLERFYILSTPWIGIYLHRFWADDDDGLHDHPWRSISVLLRGSYFEELPERQGVPYGPTITKIRKPLHPIFHFRGKHDAHRITLGANQPGSCWSLFIRFGFKRRTWGFYRNKRWEPALIQSRKEEIHAS